MLLWELCCGPLPPLEQLEARQALAKQLAHILDFVLRFDELKMKAPAMQNDFSFYRRTMSRKWFTYGIAVSALVAQWHWEPEACKGSNSG